MSDDLTHDPDTPGPDPEDDLLAAEYALRLLTPDLERAMDRRLGDDPEFAARVRTWEARLSAMAEDLDDLPPSPAVRRALMSELFPASQSRSRRWWLGSGLGLATLAALLVIAPVPSLRRGPSYAAQIASEDGALRLTASVDGDELVLARLEGTARPGRALELWLIAEDDPAPVSLGVLPTADRIEIALAPTVVARLDGAALAVSDEPPGGSPTGAPTGDVLAVAALVAL